MFTIDGDEIMWVDSARAWVLVAPRRGLYHPLSWRSMLLDSKTSEDDMTKSDFQILLNETFEKMRKLTAAKGEEYSRDADQLANFYRGMELGVRPEQVNLIFLRKHLDSITAHVAGKVASSEPIRERIDDAILYLILLKAILQERPLFVGMPPEIDSSPSRP